MTYAKNAKCTTWPWQQVVPFLICDGPTTFSLRPLYIFPHAQMHTCGVHATCHILMLPSLQTCHKNSQFTCIPWPSFTHGIGNEIQLTKAQIFGPQDNVVHAYHIAILQLCSHYTTSVDAHHMSWSSNISSQEWVANCSIILVNLCDTVAPEQFRHKLNDFSFC